jgi:hypothetical protein
LLEVLAKTGFSSPIARITPRSDIYSIYNTHIEKRLIPIALREIKDKGVREKEKEYNKKKKLLDWNHHFFSLSNC